ncbi:MAG: ABC transporter ATP-binding protein [Thomasclavelia sp.]|nr:ABC transporter ATP-binding protein [Thomasclavelia sp.]
MKNNISRLLSYCKPYKRLLILSVILSIINVCLNLLVPILLGQAIDCMIGQGSVNFDRLKMIALTMVLVIIMYSLIQWSIGQISNFITYNMSNDLRNKCYEKINHLPLSSIDNTNHGQMISVIINDIDLISQGLLQSFNSLLSGIFTIVGILIIMFVINYKIAFIVLCLTPLSLLVASKIVKKTHVLFRTQLDIRAKMYGYADEMIGNQDIVKAFTYEDINKQRFDDINMEMEKSGIISQFYGALVNPSTRLVNSLVYGSVCIAGAIMVLNGAFTVGILSAFLTYANQYTKPFNDISSVMSEMQIAIAASSRVFDLLDSKEDPKIDNPLKITKDEGGHIVINDISFRYKQDVPLIENFSLEAKPGETIAIVGKTGCGKTTLINLLMRFYDPMSGNISIDGVDIAKMDKDYLRSLYGMVLQDSWLFEGTIKDNIAYGSNNASDDEIIEAAKTARVHKYIMSLKDGYDTMLEEDGGNLSKGQQQLICIARIMLKKPPMLILDEATSSIDTRTEIQIQNAFDTMMEGRTTFVVAHRLSTIVNASKIIVMDNGHIIEQGNHYDLLKKKGFYFNLYNSQFDHSKD